MKYILVTILGFIVFSCKQNTKPEGLSAEENEICGGWSMCAYLSGETVIQSNVCKGIFFNTDGSGSISLQNDGSPVKQLFNWKLNKNLLTLTYYGLDINKALPDSDYIFLQNQEDNSQNMNIHSTDGFSAFYLSRSSK
ncbi:MAG: hypothetical protein J0L56_03755 [Chitinophagales bacterium]|nr:hypothetical protein [Chitinophagales bacterium]